MRGASWMRAARSRRGKLTARRYTPRSAHRCTQRPVARESDTYDPVAVECDVCLQPLAEPEAHTFPVPLAIDVPGSKTIDLRCHELCTARLRQEVG